MTHTPTRRQRGFLLMELAIALLVIGGLVALLVPLWTMQGQLESGRQDTLQLQQAREALLQQAVVAGGLPAPIQFEEGASDGASASSHSELSDTLATLNAGWPGALPGHLLGVPTVSPLQTAYWYDVQPALRGDVGTGFYPLVDNPSGVWSFDPIVTQFDPDQNPRMSTGGNRSQLCRNLNTLQAIDQGIRVHTTGSTANYARENINLTLPRIWATGYESRFSWDSALGYAGFTGAGTDATDDAFDNSSAVAFAVVRRQPPALRRLDRQNTVYQQVGLSGLDPSLSDRGYLATEPQSYPTLGATRGFRIYENPRTPTVDDPKSDNNDYGGLVQAVSLGEFADTLRQAGLCTAPAEACKANQLFVRFSNHVGSAPPTGTGERLTMRWELAEWDSEPTDAALMSGDVSSGSTTDGVCLDAFGTDTATDAPHRLLRISFISPSGSALVFREGLFVDPTGTAPLPTGDQGATRWLNLDALSASEGGKTVTLSCTGFHAVSAEGVTGTLVDTGVVPTCAVTQLP